MYTYHHIVTHIGFHVKLSLFSSYFLIGYSKKAKIPNLSKIREVGDELFQRTDRRNY